MRVLVCGSRDWDDEEIIWTILEGFDSYVDSAAELAVIEGECRGADLMAKAWAVSSQVPYMRFPADWENRPRWLAGPERNQRMLEEGKPDVVLAFKDGFDPTLSEGGTEDMVKRAKKAGVPVYVISHG